jgi:hypothetical protein
MRQLTQEAINPQQEEESNTVCFDLCVVQVDSSSRVATQVAFSQGYRSVGTHHHQSLGVCTQ